MLLDTSPKNVIYFWFSWYFVRDTAAAAHKNAIDKIFISLFLVDKVCCCNQSFSKMELRCILLFTLTKARKFFFGHKRTFLAGLVIRVVQFLNFKLGVQNWKDFCLNIHIPKAILRIGELM